MKKIIFFIFLLCQITLAQQQNVTYSVTPSTIEEDQMVTLTFNGSSINEATWNVINNELYLWSWSYDLNLINQQDAPNNGDWTDSSNATTPNLLTYNAGNDTYSISFIPQDFYNRTGIGRIGFLLKAKDASGDKKSQDILEDVGSFQVILTTPEDNSTTIIDAGSNFDISANNTGGSANYVLSADGTTIDTQNGVSSYNFQDTAITVNKNYILDVTVGGQTKTKSFSVVVDPGSTFAIMPTNYQDGITYDPADPTKATLVLYAQGKDFVYVAGSFNNWQPDSSYAMKRDPTRNNKYWITLTGLTPGQIETYQYWVVDKTPLANSPKLVKVADPYSTLVLSPFDDPYIPTTSYPNIPTYPIGQDREVTVLQTGQTDYPWVVTNFEKPKKEDLVIYEVLVRDFDANKNFQDIIDRIDYFKNLNINAIQLMPIMEFEGNESWGYNTSFHMALDKYYGTEDKLKELIDICHQNGIAVILDLALNHAFGRNPMVRMWMDDADGDGWGEPSSENPYFNQVATHSYSVGSDFDHSNSFTKVYSKRVVKQWIEEYKIDGFRWDLTKGFTQNASSGETQTNAYQADRVAILKEYADYSWSLDPDHYVIFEHLGFGGSAAEEKEWADYRIDEGKGIMLWGKMTDPYNQLTMGYSSGTDISRMGHKDASRNYDAPRLVGYPESHDEERLMYKNIQFGNSTNTSHNVTNLEIATKRMSALGAVSLTIPGPKMIWHFGELAMENSIYTCNNGTVNTEADAIDGNCKLDTKPQPQWTNGWLTDVNRSQVYNDWSRINDLKVNEAVFEGDYIINDSSNPNVDTLTPRIYIFDNTIPSTELKNVVILANFDVTSQNVTPDFPYTGTWYDLMDPTNSTFINVSNTATPITIPAGEFKIYGNSVPQSLSTNQFEITDNFKLYPNPAKTSFKLTTKITGVKILDVSGKQLIEYKGTFDAGHQFNIENLVNGLYIIQLEDTNGQTKISKLIKS